MIFVILLIVCFTAYFVAFALLNKFKNGAEGMLNSLPQTFPSPGFLFSAHQQPHGVGQKTWRWIQCHY